MATARGADQPLHPRGHGSQVFIRDLEVERIWIEEPVTVDAAVDHPSVDDFGPQRVVILCSGCRYVEDLATQAVLCGSPEDEVSFRQILD